MTVQPQAHAAAAARLVAARGSIREAFDGLGCGLTFEDLCAYVERDFHARNLWDSGLDLDAFHARLCGLVAGAALTVVEADRARAARSRDKARLNVPLARVLLERAQDGYVNPTGGRTTGRERKDV